MSTAKPTAIVVGGGLGGLWATLRLVEAGVAVDLFALFEVKRSHSACAQGGINAVLDTKGQGDSDLAAHRRHHQGRRLPGRPAADQDDVRGGPGPDPHLRAHGGHLLPHPGGAARPAPLRRGEVQADRASPGPAPASSSSTGWTSRCARYEDQGLVRKHEWWEMLSLVLDADGRCRGITALDLRDHAGGGLRRRRRRAGHRRPGADLRQVHQLVELHRRRRQPGLPAGRRAS